MNDILMIYPILGSMDSMVMDIPLSVIYASADSVKRGIDVRVLDLRCHRSRWQGVLRSELRKGFKLAGISVMTGLPLYYAREISQLIKNEFPETKVVWGGPHPTVIPETVEYPFIDFTVSGFGSVPLADLYAQLVSSDPDFSRVSSLAYKKDGKAVYNARSTAFEMLGYKDIPYHLIDILTPSYQRGFSGERLFPLFTSVGCPYQCAFCISPATYAVINGAKWLPLPNEQVVDHMAFAVEKYQAKHICIMDDTCFPDLKRMTKIFQEIINRGLKVTLEFRGARFNELDRMDDDFLKLMIRAGGRFLMVGFESGSDRILKIMRKGITKEQILRVNKKLARFPELVPYYNLIYGVPGEKYEDLLETKETVLQLVKDNPNCFVGFGGDWKPIPGAQLVNVAVKDFGYVPPKTMDEWIAMDSSDADKIVHPWYTKKHNALIKLMQVTLFVIDDKINKSARDNKTFLFTLLKTMSRIYKPIALFRLRNNIHQCLVEYWFWKASLKVLRRLNMKGDAAG